jgi:hypothetical protein
MKLKDRNGIPYPAKMKRRSWIVVGPPGCGKSYLIQHIGGYPGEVGIDISQDKWWTVEPLSHRPRELHFAFPFKGRHDALPVYDDYWKGLQDFPELDFKRICLPKKHKFIWHRTGRLGSCSTSFSHRRIGCWTTTNSATTKATCVWSSWG